MVVSIVILRKQRIYSRHIRRLSLCAAADAISWTWASWRSAIYIVDVVEAIVCMVLPLCVVENMISTFAETSASKC